MVAPPSVTRIPLSRAVDSYLDRCDAQVAVNRLSERTVDNYRRDLAEFVSDVTSAAGQDVITDDVTPEMVDAAVARFGARKDRRFTKSDTKGSAPRRGAGTQARYWQSVHRFFREGERQGWVQVSPMPLAAMRPEPPKRGDIRTARTAMFLEEAANLLRYGVAPDEPDARPHERHERRDLLIVHLLAVCGPRVSELCAADIGDFTSTSEGYSWRIVGKGRKVRHLPLSTVLSRLLDDYLAVRPTPRTPAAENALLLTGRGNRLNPRDVQRLLERAALRVATETGKPRRDVTPHGLRHTAATVMLSTGWDVKVVAQMCGHASIATTGAYLDEIPGELAKAIASAPLADVVSAGQR